MNGCGEHCPFLNRSDRRCSSYLSLDRLNHAFDYCFGEYKSCPVYLELLSERRVRRLCGLLSPSEQEHDADAIRRPLVALTVSSHRHAQPAAGASGIPHTPRF